MNEVSSDRAKPWNIYTSPDANPSQTGAEQEPPWKSTGASTSAISFGFVATVILVSMFLIMAIFEHLFRPNPSFSSPQDGTSRSSQPGPTEKDGNPEAVSAPFATDFSVLMPGQRHPTYIAQPAPLPCPREGVYWPSHEHSFTFT